MPAVMLLRSSYMRAMGHPETGRDKFLTEASRLQTKEFGKGMTPIDRAGQPAELAPGFVFLAVNAGECS